MDELRRHNEWAEVIAEYWPGGSPRTVDLPGYLGEMERISAMLREWWADRAQGGRGFINRIPRDARFCALSSIGHQPVWDCPGCGTAQLDELRQCASCGADREPGAALRLTRKPEPFRVRDPLFW